MQARAGLVAVTGATGHVGANLIRALGERGRPLRLICRDDQRAIAGLPGERVRADVLDPHSLRQVFEGVEVVYNLAARVSVESGDRLIGRVNVEGPRNVMRACLEAGVRRVVHFSSIHAFNQSPQHETLDETRGPAGADAPAYDQSKAAGEREVLAAVRDGLDAVIVNPTGVLGPWDYKCSPMGDVILGLIHRRLPALVEGGFNWVDVRDVVAGALAAEERGRTGERYLLSGHWHSVAEIAALVEEISGVRAPRFTSPLWAARLGAPFVEPFCKLIKVRPLYTTASLHALRTGNRAISNAKAVRELGFAARPVRETIEDTIRWHRERAAP